MTQPIEKAARELAAKLIEEMPVHPESLRRALTLAFIEGASWQLEEFRESRRRFRADQPPPDSL